jgi:chromosome segregation ATPase
MTTEQKLEEALAKVAKLEADLTQTRAEFSLRDEAIEKLNAALVERDRQASVAVAERDNKIAETAARIKQLTTDLTTAKQSLQSTLAELETAKAKLANPSREAAAICASLSTAPLPVSRASRVESDAEQDPVARYQAIKDPKERASFYERVLKPLFAGAEVTHA